MYPRVVYCFEKTSLNNNNYIIGLSEHCNTVTSYYLCKTNSM